MDHSGYSIVLVTVVHIIANHSCSKYVARSILASARDGAGSNILNGLCWQMLATIHYSKEL